MLLGVTGSLIASYLYALMENGTPLSFSFGMVCLVFLILLAIFIYILLLVTKDDLLLARHLDSQKITKEPQVLANDIPINAEVEKEVAIATTEIEMGKISEEIDLTKKNQV